MPFTRLLAACLALPLFSATPALAKLEICNESDATRAVAIGRKKDGAWGSEGWWIIKPGTCKTPIKTELKQRYYYYRATTNSEAIHDGRYRFCTSPKPFTIEGQDDCDGRGHGSALFDRIDTGKSARSFTFRLPNPPAPKGEDELEPVAEADIKPAAPAQPSRAFAPGTHGEPYTVTGVLQGCDEDDGGSYCAYHAEGWKHFARPGAGTPATVMREMELSGPGQLFAISGDMISFGDITAEVAVASFAHAGRDKYSRERDALQGFWISTTDSSYQIIIEGAEKKDLYDANLTGDYYLSFADGCQGRDNIGPVVIATDPSDRENPLCYAITSVDDRSLELSHIGGNGQSLTFERSQ
ncbi:MAG: DUF1036 domain-containing protein [Pseudomonadota bacterium]